MKNFSLLIQSLASLAWPILGFYLLFVLREDIKNLINRLAKAKILGQEIELREQLSELKRSTEKVEEAVDSIPQNEVKDHYVDDYDIEEIISKVLQTASHSPKLALVELFSELESCAQRALSKRGLLHGKKHVSLRLALDKLGEYGFPRNLLGSLSLFSEVRNKIVHGGGANDSDALSAIDSGITLLRVIESLPVETNRVKEANVKLYHDSKCEEIIEEITGVILETTSPGGIKKIDRIFPTTIKDYKVGKLVGWEWNVEDIWGPAWYRDSLTGEIKRAWEGSAEFIGPHLDEING